jgi:protein-L-isoaspartate(D-aspartate) O-methyltransferase
VLAAMSRVPRHRFVPDGEDSPRYAYGDHPCPIGHGQTISQPYIVAYMTQYLRVRPGMRILEVGLGCGYQSAVLSAMGAKVLGIELVPELAEAARARLQALGFGEVQIRVGDGHAGWPEFAPFDGILAACSAERIPDALVDQLSEDGRMILPVGTIVQNLVCITKRQGRPQVRRDIGVRFVPMVTPPKET